MGLEHRADPPRQVAVGQAAGGEVDGHAQRESLVAPAAALGDRVAQHDVGQLVHQARLLGERDEAVGADAAEVGMLPARERLDARGTAAGERELRLVLELDLAGADPAPQLAGEHQPVDAVVVVGGGIDLDRVLGGLGAVERDVGSAEELLRVVAVLGVAGDADARADVQQDPVELERRVERRDDALGDLPAVRAVARADEQHGELVAAQAGERVARSHGVAQAAGDLLQQPVAVGVAERVVDRLEIVEVDDHEHERWRRGGAAGTRAARAAARGWAGS